MFTKYYLQVTVVFACSLNPLHLANAQDANQQGFLSIDCGLANGSDYTVSDTGIYYQSDAKYIDSGESKSIFSSIESNMQYKYLTTIRIFPQGKRNCYTIRPALGKGHKYLIRATFMYGNYDTFNQRPTFDLYLGSDYWRTVEIIGSSSPRTPEIIHVLSSDYVHVCLVNTGKGTPFISALELRPLKSTNSMYTVQSGSLRTYYHIDCQSERSNASIRYPDDIYDRIWTPWNLTDTEVNTLLNINNENSYLIPQQVLSTATTTDNDSILFSWGETNTSDEFYIYMHFAEVQDLNSSEYRAFNIYVNEELWNMKEDSQPVVPKYLSVSTYSSTGPHTGHASYTVKLNKTESSTLPPIINAYEIYKVLNFTNTGTNDADVPAIFDIKSTYIIRDWQGDPCEPKDFRWAGLECSDGSSDYSARITSLDLSGRNLTGEILPSIANLTQLTKLDLSNNNLSGQVPDFLSQMDQISVLNLKGNKFTGPFPATLLEKQKEGILKLSFDGQGNEKKGNKSTLIVVVLVAISIGIWVWRRRASQGASQVAKKWGNQLQVNNGDIERKNRQFTYSDVVNITRNFDTVLGKGGFGKVYHGYVGDDEVAVKMLSPSSAQGYKEFQAEASLLLSVSHKNLTSLVGYCNEGTHLGIIYEYMAKGSLDEHLSGKNFDILSWQTRLRIALDAAQGLEYLHHGCRPAIIHRDVKTSNILLNEKFQAKLGDFGLSRTYPVEGGTHVTTMVAGTPGYLDPDYNTSSRLTEKSDVFSFGVVLLVMITGRPAISEERTHIAQWVDSIVKYGDVKPVADPRFKEMYNVNCVWKAVELAMTCASRISSRRPTMNVVVKELEECLAIEIGSDDADPNYPTVSVIMDDESSLFPEPR